METNVWVQYNEQNTLPMKVEEKSWPLKFFMEVFEDYIFRYIDIFCNNGCPFRKYMLPVKLHYITVIAGGKV